MAKYARIERERRFLLDALPADLMPDAPCWQIADRYIDGTRFRLRRMSDGNATVFKLTQKYPGPTNDFARTIITNTYLTAQEYTIFAVLPAAELHKRRYHYDLNGVRYAIDVFGAGLQGLILAEVEFPDDQSMVDFAPPPFAQAEVTHDVRFTGGALCRAEARGYRL